MHTKQTKKRKEKEERYDALIDFYFTQLNANQNVTKSMIEGYYAKITDKKERTLSNDLKAIGLKPYGSGDPKVRYYQLDIVKDLRLIMKELNQLLKKVKLYKPITTTTTLEIKPKFDHLPEITFYKIILQYPNSTPEERNYLISINNLIERYLILTKNEYSNLFYKTEYTDKGIEYTLTNKNNAIVIFEFLYNCKFEVTNKDLTDIKIYFYKKLYNPEKISIEKV